MMMDEKIELNNCPCCGGSAKLMGQRTFYVECQKCFLATDKYARPKFAAEAWNRRTEGQFENKEDKENDTEICNSNGV